MPGSSDSQPSMGFHRPDARPLEMRHLRMLALDASCHIRRRHRVNGSAAIAPRSVLAEMDGTGGGPGGRTNSAASVCVSRDGGSGRSPLGGMGDHPGICTQRAAASKVSAGVALNAIAASGACRRTRLTTRSNSSS